MRICLMIEGQEGVEWSEWLALARTCEEAGFDALFRSDHYGSTIREGEGSLDAWGTIAGLAAVTKRLRLGTLVSPVTFRHPSALAKLAATADHISDGRIELGLGAGWMEQEHTAHGFPFPSVRKRIEMLEEQLQIVKGVWTEDEFSFEGTHYRLDRARVEPKPVQEPHPPIIVGGDAGPKSAMLAARWADEYNTHAPSDRLLERLDNVKRAWDAVGRGDPRFSVMTRCIVGRDRAELEERARSWIARTGRSIDPQELLAAGANQSGVGTVDEVVEKLEGLARMGVSGVMLQHLVHRDLDTVKLIGERVIPTVSSETKPTG